MEFTDNRKYHFYIIAIIAISVFLYVLNCYYPFMHDDYLYYFKYFEHSNIVGPSPDPVKTIADVIESQFYHYQYINGRFISHTLIQIFAGILGKNVFNVINTFIIILLCTFAAKLIASGEKMVKYILLFLLLFFVSFPVPGSTVFWLTGSINYLWGTALTLITLFYFRSISTTSRFRYLIPILALCAGCMNESISIPTSGGLILYYWFNRNKLTHFHKRTIIAYLLGTAIIVCSPGTFTRIDNEIINKTASNIGNSIVLRFVVTCYFGIKYPIILATICILIRSVLKKDYLFIKKNLLYIYIFLISTLFLIGINAQEDRIYFFQVVLSWIIFLLYIRHTITISSKNRRYVRWGGTIMLLIFAYYCYSAYSNIIDYHNYNKEEIDEVYATGPDCLIPKAKTPLKENKFTYITGLEENPEDYHNRFKALYYNKNFIAAYPASVYDAIITNQNQHLPKDSLQQDIIDGYLLYTSEDQNINRVQMKVLMKDQRYYSESPIKNMGRIVKDKLNGKFNENPLKEIEIQINPVHILGKTYFFIPFDEETIVKSIDFK